MLFSFISIQAQPKLDSLQRVTNNSNLPFKERISALLKLAEHFVNVDPDSAMYFAEQQLKLATESKDLAGQGLAIDMKAKIYQAKNQPEEAFSNLHEGLTLCQQAIDSNCISKILYDIGNYHRTRNDLDSSQYYFQQSLTISEALKKPKLMIAPINGLGLVASRYGKLDEALDYYKKAAALMEQENQLSSIGLLYRNMAFIYAQKGDYKKSATFCQQSVDIFDEQGNKKEMAAGLNGLGLIAYYQKDYTEALANFEKAITLHESIHNPRGLAGLLGNRGMIYATQGNLEEAIKDYTNGLLQHRKLGNGIGEGNTLNNIGILYIKQEDYKAALRYLHQGLAVFDSIDYRIGKAGILQKIAHVHLRLGEDSLALKIANKGLELSREIGLKKVEADILIEIGEVYTNREQYQKAKENLLQALQIVRETRPNSVGRALDYLARLALKQKSWGEAHNYAKEGLTFAQKSNNISIINSISETLWKAQQGLGQYQEALETYQLFIQTKDSLLRIENQRASIRFEFQQKTLADSLKNASVLALQVAETNRRTTVSYVLLGGFVVALILGLLLWNRFRFTRRQNQIIEEEKTKLDQAYSELNIANENLNVVNEKLKEADLSKSRFFTNISHEFRTPLTVILGMTEHISEIEPRDLIKRNSQQLLSLINQILDLRSLEAGKLTPNYEQGDVIPYLKYILESFHSYSEEKEITLRFYSELESKVMDYDPEKLLSIVSNLLSNAIKFTPKGGEVKLNVSVSSSQGNEELNISVEDNGVGIAPDKLPLVFDRFYQADTSSSRQGEGTGIGLTLTKELVYILEGEITAESEMNKGTRFFVSLPITNQAPPVEGLAVPIIENIHPESTELPLVAESTNEGFPRLLIVEDNPDVVRYLTTLVKDKYQIRIAKDGQEGIDLAIEEVPDIIVSDVMMPTKDGFELCQTLKNDERTSHIPIILLTAKADFDSKLTGLGLGADVYLPKPFDKEELEIHLRNLVDVRKKLQQRYLSDQPLEPIDNPVTQRQDAFIIKAREILEENYENPEFNIPAFCKEMGMSRTQLHRKIKALTDMSASIFVREFRLEKGKILLETTDMNVSEVADATGLSSASYFSNLFKNKYGVTPTHKKKV